MITVGVDAMEVVVVGDIEHVGDRQTAGHRYSQYYTSRLLRRTPLYLAPLLH